MSRKVEPPDNGNAGDQIMKTGKFSKVEKEKIVENISAYMAERGQTTDDFVRILFKTDQQPAEQGRGRYAIFKSLFSTIAETLSRPKSAVYDCVVRLMHPKNHLGSWSAEEDRQLLEHHRSLGSHWVRIGHEIGRSSRSVRDRYRVLKWSGTSGSWTKEETDLLLAAVARVKEQAPDEKTWCWEWITDQIGSRSLWQVRRRWAEIESLTKNDYKAIDWGASDDKNLVEIIFELAVSDDSEIVWSNISKNWRFHVTPARLYARWRDLRRRIQNHTQMTTDDIAAKLLEAM